MQLLKEKKQEISTLCTYVYIYKFNLYSFFFSLLSFTFPFSLWVCFVHTYLRGKCNKKKFERKKKLKFDNAFYLSF